MSGGEGGDARPNNEDEKCGRGDRAQNDVVLGNVGGGKEGSRSVARSSQRAWSNIDSLTAWVRAMYCASVHERATVVCFLLFHEMDAPFRIQVYRPIDFRSSPEPQSASVNPDPIAFDGIADSAICGSCPVPKYPLASGPGGGIGIGGVLTNLRYSV